MAASIKIEFDDGSKVMQRTLDVDDGTTPAGYLAFFLAFYFFVMKKGLLNRIDIPIKYGSIVNVCTRA
jgi:hypothetical protein